MSQRNTTPAAAAVDGWISSPWTRAMTRGIDLPSTHTQPTNHSVRVDLQQNQCGNKYNIKTQPFFSNHETILSLELARYLTARCIPAGSVVVVIVVVELLAVATQPKDNPTTCMYETISPCK
jgi:hypothetical protein